MLRCHANDINRKAYEAKESFDLLYEIRNFTNVNALKILLYSYLRPKLEYCL